VIAMPRKATDKVIEHRITLGDLERAELKKVVTAETVKDYGTALQGVGTVALGIGGLIGGTALTMYLAPQLWGLLKDLPKTVFDNLVEVAEPVLDDAVDWAAKGLPIEHRRMAQELARRRGELDNNITYFCTASSVGYNADVCTKLNTQTKREYFDDLKVFNDMVDATYNETSTTHLFSMKAFIYQGLGDINPNNR